MDLAPFSNLPPLPSFDVIILPANLSLPRILEQTWTRSPALFSTKQRAETHFRWWSRNCDPDWITKGGGEVDKAVKLINAVLMKCYRWSSLHKPWSLEGVKGVRERERGQGEGDSKGGCLLKLNGGKFDFDCGSRWLKLCTMNDVQEYVSNELHLDCLVRPIEDFYIV